MVSTKTEDRLVRLIDRLRDGRLHRVFTGFPARGCELDSGKLLGQPLRRL